MLCSTFGIQFIAVEKDTEVMELLCCSCLVSAYCGRDGYARASKRTDWPNLSSKIYSATKYSILINCLDCSENKYNEK